MIPQKQPKPPGLRLLNNISLRTKWFVISTIGVLLFGAGLCSLTEAAHLKHTNEPTARWVLSGTYSLVLIMSGLGLHGRGMVLKARLDVRRDIRREIKNASKQLRRKELPKG